MKFFVDEMLFDIAKYLRFMGYDTIYARGMNDNEILLKCKDRILITSDRELYERAIKSGIKSLFIDINLSKEEKLSLLLSTFKLTFQNPLRCILCNSPLEKIEKEKVKGKVPSQVFRSFSQFFICKKCKKIYWQGSHFKRMKERIEKARKD